MVPPVTIIFCSDCYLRGLTIYKYGHNVYLAFVTARRCRTGIQIRPCINAFLIHMQITMVIN